MLSNFAAKLATTNLCSSILKNFTKKAKNGRTHYLIKASSKPRRNKAEMEEFKVQQEEERAFKRKYLELESVSKEKNWKIEDVPHIMKENEDIKVYLQSRGLMDSNGTMKV